jgi:hypothetical protein
LPSLNGSLKKVPMAKENHYLEFNGIEKEEKIYQNGTHF